jgi:hypothetical protein
MPTHSFMLADVAGCIAAVCLFALFVLLPGYAIAWLTGLFDFRRRTLAFQFALSIPLSIAICPVLTYFAWRFGSMTSVWAFYVACWVCALMAASRRRLSLAPYTRIVVILCAAWIAIAIFSLIDLQIGARDWYPSAAFDYSIRTQFIHSIGATGVPPANPFYFPGHPVAVRYHYFWLLLCALVDRAGGSLVTARDAWIGGAVWCGFGFMALVALYFRLFAYRGPESFRRRALTGILLLSVTGLDILPTAILWVLQSMGIHAIRPAMEWWNEQVDGFVYTALWEVHYLCGLIACLTAFLILWHASSQPARVRVRYGLLAGLALATASGTAIYVAFVFGIFLLVWTAMALAQRRPLDCAILIGAGMLALALALPFALSLRGPAMGGPPLEFWIRPFSPVDGLLRGMGRADSWRLPLANALALPLNYFLELGFFLAAAVLWWTKRRGRPFTPAESATWVMIAVSVTICTFLRSSVIGNNDLGWRGFLIAQFGLLVIAVDVLSDIREKRAFLIGLVILGAAGSAYEIGINRLYAPLADRGVVPLFYWLAPDRHAGERNYANREAGEFAARSTGPNAIVQFNPHTGAQNTSALLYSDRPSLAADESCMSTFGGDPGLCPALIAELDRVYKDAAPDLGRACRTLPMELIAASDTDAVWSNRQSWVWTETPVFANAYVRLFRCR